MSRTVGSKNMDSKTFRLILAMYRRQRSSFIKTASQLYGYSENKIRVLVRDVENNYCTKYNKVNLVEALEGLTQEVKLKKKEARQTIWQRKHRAMGLCVTCSEPAYKGWRCVKHYEQHKIMMRFRYTPLVRGRYDVGLTNLSGEVSKAGGGPFGPLDEKPQVSVSRSKSLKKGKRPQMTSLPRDKRYES